MTDANLTERQAKWFASIRAGLERETGKSLEDWVAIARSCPETGHRARLKWLKDNHGLLQNRASHVLGEAFGITMPWKEPESLINALWTDPASRAIFEVVDAQAMALDGALRTARKGYTAWSRKVQFAAIRPARTGTSILGLAVLDSKLDMSKSPTWSERLKSQITLSSPRDVDNEVVAWLRKAWEGA